MKVLIATEKASLDSQVAKRFGHAPYYLIVNSERNLVQVINDPEHDDDHSIILQLAKDGVEVFITGNIGPHAYELIRSLNLSVALARRMSANEALSKLQLGQLKILDAPTLQHSVHEHAQHQPNKKYKTKHYL